MQQHLQVHFPFTSPFSFICVKKLNKKWFAFTFRKVCCMKAISTLFLARSIPHWRLTSWTQAVDLGHEVLRSLISGQHSAACMSFFAGQGSIYLALSILHFSLLLKTFRSDIVGFKITLNLIIGCSRENPNMQVDIHLLIQMHNCRSI